MSVFNRVCPKCSAGIGQPCTGRRGARKYFHQERSRGWKGRKMAKPGFDGTEKKIEKLINEAAQAEMMRFIEEFLDLADHCGSPIEKLLLAALFADHRIGPTSIVFMGQYKPSDRHKADETIYIYQQAEVGKYRADFLIYDRSVPAELAEPRWMIVECDGHDFHERTKEQARHDKQRDRFFQSKGYKVLRFTGSEIWQDAEGCANEIINELQVDDAWRNRDK